MSHAEFCTDQTNTGQYRLTFVTDDKRYFLAMQELARKCVDHDFPEAILNADLDRHALKIAKERGDEENVAYYKEKLNAIFGKLFTPQTKIEKMVFSTKDLPKCRCTEEDNQ